MSVVSSAAPLQGTRDPRISGSAPVGGEGARGAALRAYVARERTQISGWLSRVDAEIFRTLLDAQTAQGLSGAVAEIGVHHGKAFIALCLGRTAGEKGYCIDVFDSQHLNQDASGEGDRSQFEANLRRFGVQDVVIRESSSMDVTADEILGAVGPVRMFSVDGGHWREVVENDLALAQASLADHGVIALDDFHRTEWPDVSVGLMSWLARQGGDFVPIAIGFNKLYLCRRPWLERYRASVTQDPFLSAFVIKCADLLGDKPPVLNQPFLPENDAGENARAALITYWPELLPAFLRMDHGLRTLRARTKAAALALLGRRAPARDQA